MPNPALRIEKLELTVQEEARRCQWGKPSSTPSAYEYISKAFLQVLRKELTQLKEECEFLQALQATETRKLDQIIHQEHQIHQLEKANDALEQDLHKSEEELTHLRAKPEKEVHPTLHILKKLRSIHGGDVISPDEYKQIIAEVDSVIAGGM